MVAISKRMAKLRSRLLDIRLGPGALLLPPSLSRIHLSFAPKLNLGHLGPRKFTQHYLPRLKYHNPAVHMTVDRTAPQDGPATMTLTFAEAPTDSSSPSSSTSDETSISAPAAPITSTTTPQTSTAPVTPTITPSSPLQTRIETIEMKHLHESAILRQLVSLTGAKEVLASAEEREELERLEKRRVLAEKDRVEEKERREAAKRREAMLKGAREAQA